MSEVSAPQAPGRDPLRLTYTAIVIPVLVALFALWAGWRSSGNIALALYGSAAALFVLAAVVGLRGQPIPNPQDYYGGVVLIGLALFVFWAGSDLPGMRGFSFGPGTAPRLFASVLLVLAVGVTAIGLLVAGP